VRERKRDRGRKKQRLAGGNPDRDRDGRRDNGPGREGRDRKRERGEKRGRKGRQMECAEAGKERDCVKGGGKSRGVERGGEWQPWAVALGRG